MKCESCEEKNSHRRKHLAKNQIKSLFTCSSCQYKTEDISIIDKIKGSKCCPICKSISWVILNTDNGDIISNE
jgi:rubrerythrin